MSTPGPSSPRPHRAPQYSAAKSQRILACILCQQRKVKCDRKFPCANCIKHKAQCVPSMQPRPRRRRFPERQLLDRLRSYEELLRQNKIKFEPLHNESGSATRSHAAKDENEDSGVEQPESEGAHGSVSAGTSKPRSAYEAKYGAFHYSTPNTALVLCITFPSANDTSQKYMACYESRCTRSPTFIRLSD